MSNVLDKQDNGISNLFELQAISNRIKNIETQTDEISNDMSLEEFERKIRVSELTKEKNFLKNKLLKGINIEKPSVVEEIKTSIISILEQYGFKTDEIIKKIDNIQFYITNERLSSGGLMSSYSNKIAIDYTCAEFDENGKFLGLKKDAFIRYILAHEILHICSINQNESFMDDALSEGYTDLLARLISPNTDDKSTNYDYFVKICTLFTSLVGMKEMLEDYFFNLKTLPNLQNLFKQCGLMKSDFFEFYSMLNNTMELQYENKNDEEIYNIKKNLIEKIKQHILIPYLRELDCDKENYINLFNNLFSDFNISCLLDELNQGVK